MSTAGPPRITDPRHAPLQRPNPLEQFGLSLINDPRDFPFIQLMTAFTVVMLPFAAYLFIPGNFNWWLGALYVGLLFGAFFDRCILMLHNTSHRVLFKPHYRILRHYIPWVLGPFFGQSPEGYFGHHMGMHHPENNLEKDLSTTMPYARDSFLQFLKYWAIFMMTTPGAVVLYLIRNDRKKLAYKALIGELLFLGGCGLGLWLTPGPTFVVFVLPFLLARFLMMWGNWGQHAFIDSTNPENPLVNSITCINARYNRRCFNDGYHIGHHVKANRHWTDLPADLEKNARRYGEAGAIVFEGIDFFQVSLYLFLNRYDWLAKRFVELGDRARTDEEVIAFLKSRTRPILRQGSKVNEVPAVA